MLQNVVKQSKNAIDLTNRLKSDGKILFLTNLFEKILLIFLTNFLFFHEKETYSCADIILMGLEFLIQLMNTEILKVN